MSNFFTTIFTVAALVTGAYELDFLTYAGAMQMAVTFAVSIVASRLFAPNIPQSQQNNVRQQVPPDPTAGIPLVYGDAYTGGRFCDAVLTTDQTSMYYVMVISCISPNGQFSFDTSKFYYQDQIITFDTTDLTKVVSLTDQAGNVDTSISGHLYISLYTSSQTGTITPINTSNQPSAVMSTANGIPSGQEWVSSNRQMNGTAFAIVQLVYNANSLGTTALQPVTFHVSHYLNGDGCAKPGDVWYDYMTNTVYGAAVPSQFVSSASVTALNSYSDELITYTPAGGGSASIPRYRFNGVLDTGQTALSNIDLMMNCCDSWQSYQVATGLWTVVVNKAISPTFSFDDSNIISDITVSELDLTQMVNQIEARFIDSGNRDQPGYVNLQTPSGLLLPNEPVNKFTISYDLINSSVTAQYLANRVLEQNRLDLIVSFSTNYTGIQVNAGDVVTVTNSYYGWSNQQFRVMQVKEVSLPDGSLGASFQMMQYDPNVYATSSITAYTPTPHSGLAAPTFFSSLFAPTVIAHRETANIPSFDLQIFIPTTGRVTTATLFYSTYPTPTTAQWNVWQTVQTANNQPAPNGTYQPWVDIILPAGTYYFAYQVGSGTSLSALSPISAAFVWAPTGMSGASGASGYSGYSGLSGNSGVSANKYATAYLYQWSTTTPGDPSGTSTYTWSSGANSSYTGANGWSTTVPANPGISGISLWVASKQVTDIASATSTSVSWTSGFSKYVAGQNGTAVNGVQMANATVYQWAASIPTISGTSTYTWSNNTISSPPSGWFTSISDSPSVGYTLFAASVNLTDSVTATTTTINWSSASIVPFGYVGSTGAVAATCYTVTSLSALNTTPFTITTSGSTSVPPSGSWGGGTWSYTVPTLSSGQSLWQSNGVYNPATGNIIWGVPYLSSLKVGNLSALSTNTGNLTVTGTFQANTAALSGTTMTGSGGVLYSTGYFAFGNSTSNIINTSSGIFINGFTQNNTASFSGGSISSAQNLLSFSIAANNASYPATLATNGMLSAQLNSAPTAIFCAFSITLNLYNTTLSASEFTYSPIFAVPCINYGGGTAYVDVPYSFAAVGPAPAGSYNYLISGSVTFYDSSGTSLGTGAITYYSAYTSFFQPLV
jgi:hypothetical protein